MKAELIKDLFLDAVFEIFYFPYWWYSAGLKKTGKFCLRQIKEGWRMTALGILLANFFKPMYAQRGFTAYFLSFLVRSCQIIWRLVFMILWICFWLLMIIAWVILPIAALIKLIIG